MTEAAIYNQDGKYIGRVAANKPTYTIEIGPRGDEKIVVFRHNGETEIDDRPYSPYDLWHVVACEVNGEPQGFVEPGLALSVLNGLFTIDHTA